jgi:hypothetical protein
MSTVLEFLLLCKSCTARIDSPEIDFPPFIFMAFPSSWVSNFSHFFKLKLILITQRLREEKSECPRLEGNLEQSSCVYIRIKSDL